MTNNEITHEELIDLNEVMCALAYEMADRHDLKLMRDYLSAAVSTIDKLLGRYEDDFSAIIAEFYAIEDC